MSVMRADSRELPLSTIPLCQLLPCHFGPPRPTLSINLYVKGCLDSTIGAFHMSIPSESSLLQNEVRSSMPSRTSSSLDLVVTMSCGLTLQICLIIALSFRCRCWRFGFVNGQVSLAWSIVLRTQELYTRPLVLKVRWHEERTGCRSWNFLRRFSHVLWLKVHSHLLLRACLLGSKRKLPPQACQVRPGLPSAVCHPRGVQVPGTVYICSQGPFSSA